MLILERRPGQSILIGEDIVVRILGFSEGGRIRVKVQAPHDATVACKNEAFLIGKDIKVHVVARTENGAKIGVEAPRDVHILRAELRKSKEKQRTTQ